MERAPPGQFYSAPNQAQYEYAVAEARNFADQPPTSSSLHHQEFRPNADHNTPLHTFLPSPSSADPSPYSDQFIPTQTMIQSLFIACDTHKEAFDSVYAGNATETHFATLGREIMSPEQDGRLWPVAYYVEVAKKIIDYVTRYFVGWFQCWRKPSASQWEIYPGPFSARHLAFLQNAAYAHTGHFPPLWKNTAIRCIGGYPSAWGYALGPNGEPVWTNASLVGPEFNGRDVVVDPIAVLTSSTVSPAHTIASVSPGTAVSSSASSLAIGATVLPSSSPACPGDMSSMTSMSSAKIPQNKTLTRNANVGSVPPSAPQQGSGLNGPFTMSSESAARRINHQTAAHAPYSTVPAQLSQHGDPSYPAQPFNYSPPGHQHPPSIYSSRPTAAPATSSDISFAPARSCLSSYAPAPTTGSAHPHSYIPPPATGGPVHARNVSGYPPPPATDPARLRVSGYPPPPATDPVHARNVSGYPPPPATDPARLRVSDYAPPPVADPVRLRVSDYAPPPVADPARLRVSDYAPPPVADPVRLRVSDYAPPPVADPARLRVSDYAPPPVADPARLRVSDYAPPLVADPTRLRVSGYAPPPVADPARLHVSGAAPPPTGTGSARSLVSSYAPALTTDVAHPLVSGSAPSSTTDPARQAMSDPSRPALRAATQDPPVPRTMSYNDFVPNRPSIKSVPDAVNAPIDQVSQWNHQANMELRREKTRQLEISLETKKVDQNLESMRMQMQSGEQITRKAVTPAVRHKSSLHASSQGSSSKRHPYGPSPASSPSSNRRRRSNVSIPSHAYQSTSSVASHSQHSNSSLASLQFDRLIMKPSGNPAVIPAFGGQGYSGGDPASSGRVDGKGMGSSSSSSLANALGNGETCNVPDKSHSNRHEFANAMDGCGDTPSGFANATNALVHTTGGHARTMYGGAVHATDGRADVQSGSAEATNGRVHPTEGDIYMAGGFANGTNGHVHDGRVPVTDGGVNDSRAPSTYYGYVNNGHVHSTPGYVDGSNGRSYGHDGRVPVTEGYAGTSATVHHTTGGYNDATSGHYLQGGNDHMTDDRPGATALDAYGSTTARNDTDDRAMSWMYENDSGIAVDANSVYAAGGGFPATNGI